MANNARTIQDLERKYDFASLLKLDKNVRMQAEGLIKTNNELNKFITSTTQNIEDLTNVVDAKTEIWFYEGQPTLSNLPASEWETEEEKANHIGDLYYDTSNGYSYRFALQMQTYLWVKIVDEDVSNALRIASTAQDTADNKRQIFTEQPIPPYDTGDLYIKNKELYICKNARSEGSYIESDFDIATKYTDDSNLNNFIDNIFTNTINSLTNQIDGKIATWYYEGLPTLNNLPASEWATEEEKVNHIGDLYYDKATGYTYIFEKVNSVYAWNRIKDNDIVEAMASASTAQDTADNKRQVFTSQPTPPYDVGDLYVKNKELYICKNARSEGSYIDSDFDIATKYTDDTSLNNFIDVVFTNTVTKLTNQIDGKITTWYYAGQPTLANFPANEWITGEDKLAHTGDLYYDKTTGYTYIFEKVNSTYAWNRIKDNDIVEAMASASTAQDTADNKRQVFTSQPTPPYDVGDLYVKNKELYICQHSRSEGNYAESDFTIATKYTDDTKADQVGENLNNFIDVTFSNTVTNLTNQIDGKITTWYYAGQPTLANFPANEWITGEDKLAHTGDLYYDKTTGYTYIFEKVNSTYAWNRIKDNDIVEAMASANAAQDTADNKRQIFVTQPTTPYSCGDLWISSNEIYVCQVERLTGNYNSADWINDLKYTDDTYAQAIVTELGGEETTILHGTVIEKTDKWVKFTDLETGGSTVINGANITTGTINTDNVTIGNGNVQLDEEGLKLSNGAKVVGENGLMNTYLFASKNNSFALCGYVGNDYTGWHNTRVDKLKHSLIFNIPEGLNITSAKLKIFHAPTYWTYVDSSSQTKQFWGYCRNLKLYRTTNIYNKLYSCYFNSEYDLDDTAIYQEINGALGNDGWTPTPPTNTQYNTEIKESIDIKESITSGLNELVIQPEYDATQTWNGEEISKRTAYIYAMIKIDGYMSY